ncbi:OLC1v1016737C1 [Oldenlandia corymbosa var. corymbosa]|uniref:OLC1v1016737C1 n=1 Tax=Oldenlandia corymbosa var. corymbosa TaxID=529605 RepID=A0AAV1E7T1_OLDCO|nr:OLC1v1016737C1 [Oldenlandia corymbosa var. corymbosa]
MRAVRGIGSYISRSVYTVSGPFHPFGGAVDIIAVEQQDGTFKSSPWYVRFGKFQGVLKATEKVVSISVNGVEADFNMYLDHKGEAYFLKEVDFGEGDAVCSPSSSGEDTDGQSHDGRPVKSKSCNYDALESSSLEPVDLSKGKVLARTNSRHARILGLVFGRKAMKKDTAPEEENNGGVIRSESLERAEIAADLLEVKWCTNLASPKSKKESLSLLSSQPKLESNDSEDNVINDSDDNILQSGKSEQVYVETVHTTGVVCQVNSQAETSFKEKGSSSIGDDFENENVAVSTLDENTPENAAVSSSSTGNGFVTTYAQTVTLQPVSGCGQTIESRSIVTISTLSNATCQSLGEETSCAEETSSAEDKQRESEPPMKPVRGSIQLDILTSEITEEEQLLFGDFDDFSAVKEMEEPISPECDVKEGDPQLSEIEPEKDLRRKLKSISSHINIPATGGAKSEVTLRYARSLPNMPSNKYTPTASDYQSLNKCKSLSSMKNEAATDSQYQNELTAEDANTTAKGGLINSAIDTTRSNTCTEDRKDLPKLKLNKKKTRSIVPTSEQLASLNLKEGMNSIVFTFSTPVLGKQQVHARIYLWKWDARVVISDVDGTITRSDLLGQFMPLVGVDWSQTGVAHLFSAIKENGYQLLFLSARAISQAYRTRQFLFNLKQDGKFLPEGPVVISPDGLFPSLYREVVRRAPHEFKIACLEAIKALFPADRNPFYAGFGNRDTDEISYLKVGIPKGKIFIINPKGEIVVNRRVDTRTYTSLHTLVHDMFPPLTSSEQQEDYNSWNYWKLPPPGIEF